MSNDTPHSVVSALDELEEQQQLFVREYMKDLNGTKAAIRAKYSEDTAAQQASRLLRNVKVQKAMSELKAERNNRLNVDANYVLERLLEIDQLDVLDILGETGEVKPVKEWPKSWRTNIASFEVSEIGNDGAKVGQVVKLKFPDKVKNLDMLGRHIVVGAWVTSSQVDINANIKAEVSTISDLMDELGDET